MDLGIIPIMVIILAICILPFIFMSRSRKKREKKFLQSLSKIAEKHNCNITQHEFCGDFIIGLDEIANAVFFFKQVNNKETAKYINLTKIQSCTMINTSKTIKTKNSSYKEIDKLEFNFLPTAKYKPNILLEFYNYDESLPLSGQLELMEKWLKIINDKLVLQKNKETQKHEPKKIYNATVA